MASPSASSIGRRPTMHFGPRSVEEVPLELRRIDTEAVRHRSLPGACAAAFGVEQHAIDIECDHEAVESSTPRRTSAK